MGTGHATHVTNGKITIRPSDFAASRLVQGSTQSHDIYGFASKLVSIQESNKTT